MGRLDKICEAKQEGNKKKITLKSLANFEQKEAEWLVSGYIPKNQITIIGGDGGTGKTSLWCNIVASLSNGEKSIMEHEIPFDNPPEPKKIIFFSSEDDIECILKDRLSRYNANMDNIFSINLSENDFSSIKFDSAELEDVLAEYRPDLVIFDPLQSFLPHGVQMSSRNEMREALNHLIALGQRYSTTFIIIMHTNKRKGVYGRNRLADSADTWDIARSVLIVGKDKDNNRYVSQEKNNYGCIANTIMFTLSEGLAEFLSFSQKHDKEFVNETDFEQHAKPKTDDAIEYIINALENSDDGKCAVKELNAEMEALGYSDYSIRNAKQKLKKQGKIIYSNNNQYSTDKVNYLELKKKKPTVSYK